VLAVFRLGRLSDNGWCRTGIEWRGSSRLMVARAYACRAKDSILSKFLLAVSATSCITYGEMGHYRTVLRQYSHALGMPRKSSQQPSGRLLNLRVRHRPGRRISNTSRQLGMHANCFSVSISAEPVARICSAPAACTCLLVSIDQLVARRRPTSPVRQPGTHAPQI
jgi:hypothetical protein